MHHLAHAHSQLTTGDLISGMSHKDIANAAQTQARSK
jgi:hypothetical protein